MLGPVGIRFALYPHTGGWEEADVLAAMERYQHPLVTVRGTARGGDDTRPMVATSAAGLSVEGRGVVLSALCRQGEALEVRLVNLEQRPTEATVRGAFAAATRFDLLGRPGEPLGCEAGFLRLTLGPAEIATFRLT